jgi:hypothetical protein
MRLTFCNGQSIDLPPLNDEGLRFVAAKIDTARYGSPAPELLDDRKRPLPNLGGTGKGVRPGTGRSHCDVTKSGSRS